MLTSKSQKILQQVTKICPKLRSQIIMGNRRRRWRVRILTSKIRNRYLRKNKRRKVQKTIVKRMVVNPLHPLKEVARINLNKNLNKQHKKR